MAEPDSLSQPLTTQDLIGIGLFAALPETTLGHLATTLRVRVLAPGDVVFREGDRGSAMYVVIGGEFEVVKRSKRGVDARVALLGGGDWFGEMSILDVQPRSATVRALACSRLVVITAADLDGLYRRDTRSYALLVLNIARELSRRLRVTDGILAELATNLLADLMDARHVRAT